MIRLFTAFLFLVGFVNAQTIPERYPDSVELLDFGPEVQEMWAKRDALLKELNEGTKDWETLSEEDEAIFYSCPETFSDMWDIEGGGCSWYCAGGPKEVTASSYLPSQGDNSYLPENAHDLDYKNAWVEGVKGYGVGEYLLYTFDVRAPRITQIKIVNGYVKSEKAWKNNSRVKKLKVYLDDVPFAIFNLEDKIATQTFNIDPIGNAPGEREGFAEGAVWTLKFEILEVYEGDKYDDTVIAEIYFDGLDVHCLASGTKITMADGTLKNIEELKPGERVLSWNEVNQLFEPAEILDMDHPYHTGLIELKMDKGKAITCTQDHPFLGADLQWYSYEPEKTMKAYGYKKVLLLKEGVILKGIEGLITINKIKAVKFLQNTHTIVSLSQNSAFVANGVVTGTEPLTLSRNHQPFVDRLGEREEYNIIYSSYGCFHNTNDTLTISKKKWEINVAFHGKMKVLTHSEVKILRGFELHLNKIFDMGCTTSDYYELQFNGETFKAIDGSCDWNGFNNLLKELGLRE